MKDKIKYIIIVVAVVILGIIVFNIFSSIGASKNGNISNLGLVCKDGKYTFYNKYEKGLFRVRGDSKSEKKITDDVANSINIHKGYIYYTTITEDKSVAIVRVKTNGKDRTVISKIYTPINKIYVLDDGIYYVSNNLLNNNVVKLALDGSSEELVSTEYIVDFQVVDNKIYFLDEIGIINSMELDGENVQELIEDVKLFQVSDKYAYFVSRIDNKLYKAKVEKGREKVCIVDNENIANINVVGKDLYFFDNDAKKIKKTDIDGSKFEEIVSINTATTKLNVSGKYLYYLDTSSDSSRVYEINRIKTNGKKANDIVY